jgi:predicted transcriptional regulator of viral defense system
MNMVLRITGEDPQIMRNQVTRWVKSHQLFQLKRGLYFFNDNERDAKGTNLFCANKIYAPSYISLETALSLYGIIPEGVSVVTSVTSKITKKFRNSLGYFTYQRIRTNAFRGFREDNFGGFPVYIAEPEKAVLDFLYLNSARFGKDPADQLRGSFRFQSGADIDPVRMRTLAAVFESKKLSRLAEAALDILGGD